MLAQLSHLLFNMIRSPLFGHACRVLIIAQCSDCSKHRRAPTLEEAEIWAIGRELSCARRSCCWFWQRSIPWQLSLVSIRLIVAMSFFLPWSLLSKWECKDECSCLPLPSFLLPVRRSEIAADKASDLDVVISSRERESTTTTLCYYNILW